MQAAIKELMDDHQVILRMLGALGGMAARIAEGGVVPADDLAAAVDFVRNFADAAHHGFPGARRHRGIAVDIDQAARRRDMPEFPHIVLAMTQRDRIQTALRRFAAHQGVETIFAEHLADRAQPVGAFRMAGRRGMVEAGRMRQQQCGHAIPWRGKRFMRKG